MPDESPPPVFPQYQPPNPNGVTVIDHRQARPLLKMIKMRLNPRPKPRVSPVKKRVAKRKKGE
jgi:hypothetical protein